MKREKREKSGRPAAPLPPPGFRPSQAMGQNFLVDPNLAAKLVAAVQIQPGDTVLEIGPGTGVLTDRLLAAGAQLHAIEKDRRLADALRRRFDGNPAFHLHAGDALTIDPDFSSTGPPTRLLSNLPYSVTTPLLLRIVFWGLPLQRIVVTVQREVAHRIVAREGREYGRLSVLIALYGSARILFDLSPEAFRPRPSVRSTALLLEPAAHPPGLTPGSKLESVVKTAFSERRKQMGKLLANASGLERAEVDRLLAACGVSPTARAEEVSPTQFVELARLLAP